MYPAAEAGEDRDPSGRTAQPSLWPKALALVTLLVCGLTLVLWHQNRELLLWLLGRRQRVRVAGRSMLPTFEPGQELFVNPHAYSQSMPQEGDVVVAWHPREPEMKIVKRVTAVLENGRLLLAGDNRAESNDSRHFGAILPNQIIGKISGKFG